MHQSTCWDFEEVRKIIKPDAEEIQDHVFKAIHSPSQLTLSTNYGGNLQPSTPDFFLKEFLDSSRSYVQAIVYGESGTGKSHFIQWLRLAIPKLDNNVLLVIPKTGTSLRGIIEKLILCLPENERTPFLSKLNNSGGNLTNHSAKLDLFLNALAWSIKHESTSTENDDIDLGLKELLPYVFLDPNFRDEFFSTKDSTVDLMVRHIFDNPETRDQELIRSFKDGDLPLSGKHYSKASAPAKDAIDFIKSEQDLPNRAIQMMNSCIESAISHTLNFSADSLIDLMTSLRIHLAKENKTLILLIEDFARVQGVDTALLQALITPPGQGELKLCDIRWAMAITSGIYRGLPNTVLSRSTLLVDMDSSSPISIESMTGSYLNAVRTGDRNLNALINSDNVVSSHCDSCSIKESCFASFGSVENIGLFPFNSKAIQNMAYRSGSFVSGMFNPRIFLGRVLDPVLHHYYADINNGNFPSTHLVEHIGGTSTLSSINRATIINLDGNDLGNRHISMLDLWDGSGGLVNLNPGIHKAFGVPLIPDGENLRVEPEQLTAPTSSKVNPTGENGNIQLPQIRELEAWDTSNGILSQSTVNQLRDLLFNALDTYIDWDELCYKKSEVSSGSGNAQIPFRKVSINFHNQQTGIAGNLHVNLTLPLNPSSKEDKGKTALSLQALILFNKNKSWDFDGSVFFLPTLLCMLEVWANSIRKQVKELYKSEGNWNPIQASNELLTSLVLQSGQLSCFDNELVIRRIWDSTPPEQMIGLTSAFNKINKTIADNWTKLQDILRLLSAGPKGGQSNSGYINPSNSWSVISEFKSRGPQFNQSPPDDIKINSIRHIAELYVLVKDGYSSALNAEIMMWKQWVEDMKKYLDPAESISVLTSEISGLVIEVESAGFPDRGISREIKDLITAIDISAVDNAINLIRKIHDLSLLETINAIAICSKFRQQINTLFDKTQKLIDTISGIVDVKNSAIQLNLGQGMKDSISAISNSLDQSIISLSNLENKL